MNRDRQSSRQLIGLAWREGRAATSEIVRGVNGLTYAFNDHVQGVARMHTDGKDLYSYRLKIGTTLPDGTKVLLDVRYTPYKVSVTTRGHLEAAYAPGVRFCYPRENGQPMNGGHGYTRRVYTFPADIESAIAEYDALQAQAV